MTEPQYENWLADLSASRILLAELHHSQGVEYVATGPFISRPTDSDPNRVYDDCLTAAVDISTRIDGLVGFGQVALLDDGSITHWAANAWQGHPIRLYLGGPDWSRDDFRLLANGRNGGISDARRGVLSFVMEDESSVFDERIDTGQLPDDAGPVPLALGSIYNAPAYLLTPDPYRFKASFLPVTALNPKDNGNPVAHTNQMGDGTFDLSERLKGTLTVDIEEAHNTPQKVCEWVADYYGVPLGDIQLPGYRVGLYYNGDVSGAQILDELCQGLGAYWYRDALGALTVRQRVLPTAAEITLDGDDIEYDQIRLASTEAPWRGLTLRWGRNYSPLTTIAGAIEEDNPGEASRLRKEWRESRKTQAVDDYPLAQHEELNSVIQDEADAATERARLLTLRAQRRETWSIKAFLAPVRVSMAITVDHPRLAGRVGRIASVSRSPTRGTTNLEIWF
ncbi:hypothetical protein [Vreelandella populi]|uniref:Tip attachment protein J domain-containing protein n=1 Tax=Vreelandella populi TaxID=2498858 RepID=A0A3S0YX20_9GAMM|nr:hypothetical protein [Halomonas populi]RUR43379.1 hypothetical protein ELY37_16815 [Halomonas populi]